MHLDLVNHILQQSGLPPLGKVPITPAKPHVITAKTVTDMVPKRSDKLSSFPRAFSIELGGITHEVKFWNGEHLKAKLLACDTETKIIVGAEVPQLALLSCSSGDETVIVCPDDAAAFVMVHSDCDFVFHHAAFDFWVLVNHFNNSDEDDAFFHMWMLAQSNRLHDSMILDQLIRLGRDGVFLSCRDLSEVAAEYAKLSISKDNPYRLQFEKIIGKEWSQVEEGFFVYAAADALATIKSYIALRSAAQVIAEKVKHQPWPDAIQRFGLLTEGTQIRAAIALGSITQNGIAIDRVRLNAIDQELASKIETLTAEIQKLSICRGLFKQDRAGRILRCNTGVPQIDRKKQQLILGEILHMHRFDGLPPVTRTKDGTYKTDEESWDPYRVYSPFIAMWLELEKLGKLRSFTQLKGNRVHPRYSVLVLTGRTSCSNPNVQQTPRKGGVRECLIPSDGNYFFIIDYSYIELVVLAAICLKRYGFSKLATIISAGIDPHVYTAALITGVSLEEFQKLKKTDPQKYKELRQKAKALNFGALPFSAYFTLCIKMRNGT